MTAAARDRRRWTAVIFLSVATTGAALQIRGAVIPSLAVTFGAPEWQLGLVAPAGTAGYLLVLLAVGSTAAGLDARRFLLVGLAGTTLALLAMGLAPAFLVFLAATLLRGTTTGVVRALDRPLLSHLHPEERGRVYNRYDMAWAGGAVAGPLGVATAIELGSWRLAYAGLALVTAVAAVLVRRLDAPVLDSEEETLTRERLARLLRRPEILAMVAGYLLVIGVEGALFTWLPYYADADPSIGISESVLSVLLVTYIPGRLVSGALAERVGYLPYVSALVVALVPAVAYTFALAEGVIALAGVVLVGLLMSGVYPTLVAYGTDAVPEHSAPVNALATGAGAVGGGSVPALVGVLIDRSGVTAAMSLLVVPLVVALAVFLLAAAAGPSGGDGSGDTRGRRG